jgi:F420-dependent oxidoreductase-like protein
MDFRVFTEPQQGASYDDQLQLARTAERVGFSAFFRSDHYLRMGPGDAGPGPTDAWTTLAGLARDTTTIRLGTLVSPVTFRHPGPLAIAVAQVDTMSGGRAELGLGAGWFDAEHTAYGVPFPSTKERFEMLDEQLAVITGLWATKPGDTFSFSGTHYQLADSPALPKPAQQPGPPVIVGGSGPKRTPALAARYATEFNIGFCPASVFADARDRVRAACGASGRDPDSLVYSVALPTVCGTTDADVERRAARRGADPEGIRRGGVAGSPAEVVEQLQAYADAGATRAYLQVMDFADLDHIELLGAEVLPALAG